MFKSLKTILWVLFSTSLLFGCGDSDAPQEKSTTLATEAPVAKVDVSEMAVPEAAEEESIEIVYLPNQVIYQEEIYKDWPYTEAPAVNAVVEMAEDVIATVTETVSDKPYQLVDGKISANALEGWKTYNGGGCGTCHGKGAIGAVGPEIGKSLKTKLSKDDFINIVTNGKPGTMMRPHKTNKRVMDNMDNLYAYLLARGDGVLGPGNLIKSPLGK